MDQFFMNPPQYMHPSINLSHLLLQAPKREFLMIYIVCSTKVIFIVCLNRIFFRLICGLPLNHHNSSLHITPTLYSICLQEAEKFKLIVIGRGTIPVTLVYLTHIYNPTPIHMFSHSLFVSLPPETIQAERIAM